MRFHWLALILFCSSTLALAKPCQRELLPHKSQEALVCYLAEPEAQQSWILKEKTKKEGLEILSYELVSQSWPKRELSAQLWKHRLTLYVPQELKSSQALIYVDGGTNNPLEKQDPRSTLDFIELATKSHSVVIDLQDIPNQYLRFEDRKPRREDGIVAYTWNRFMDNPDSGYYWPAHLPMTKAVIKAMDAVQAIMKQDYHVKIDHFVVSGASKRGLTTWLTALSDERVNAIIPIVIDILNTEENLKLINNSYQELWPPAFHDYIEAKIPERLHTEAFHRLMQIEDPITYLQGEDGEYYRQRLSIPKYIISASGDDFFVPDSLGLYLPFLPGETRVRVLPNQRHYVDMKIVQQAILTDYLSIIQHRQRPQLQWEMNSVGELLSISTDQAVTSVKLWEAVNKEQRDFRLAVGVRYSATTLSGKCLSQHCYYPLKIAAPAKGWKAAFVEVSFKEPYPFVLTTPPVVIGS